MSELNPSFAVIGLGLMGSRMAANLAKNGFELRGFDPDEGSRAEFESLGGTVARTPAEAVQGCWGALLSLPNSDISKTVCLGEDGLLQSGVRDLFVYDATTGRPADAVQISERLGQVGIDYSDSTVSGNGEVAGRGELVVMVGGTDAGYARGEVVFNAIGRSHHHVGGSGAGSRMKLLVNHLLTIHRMALAEGIVTAEMSGMDMDAALAILKDSLAYSKAMDVWGDQMIAGDHQFPYARLRQTAKDARLIVENGEAVGAPLALVPVVRDALVEGEGDGLADLDNSAIVEVIRRRVGIGRIARPTE